MIVLNLIQNVALLIALAVAYQVIGSHFPKKTLGYLILSGILFGGVGLVGMMTPLHFAPGIIFDGRSIILSVAGLFGGPIVASLSAAMCGAYRIWLGGAGAWVGIAVILESAAIGVLFYFLRRHNDSRVTWSFLYLFGLLVHVLMLGLMLGLPGGAGVEVLRQVGLPILIIYPLATVLVCQIFIDYERQIHHSKELEEREAFLSAIVENIPDMIFVKEARELRFVRFNTAGENLLGYSRDELIGKNDYDLFPKNEADFFTANDREILETGEQRDIPEEDIHTRFKGKRNLHTKKVPIYDEHGNPKYLLGISEDITDLSKSEEALRESEKRLRDVIDSTPFPVALVDTEDDKIFMWSHSAFELFGHTAPTAQEWYQIAYPDPEYRKDVLDSWRPSVEMARSSGQTVNAGEYQVTCKDGSVRTCELYAKFITDYLLVTFNDITDRKNSEEALRESESKFKHVFQSANVGKSITALTGEIRFNKAFCHLLGYTQEDLRDKTWQDLTPHEEIGPIQEILDQLVRGEKESARFSKRYIHKDGSHVWGDASVVVRRDRDGNPLDFITTVVDITERKKAEQALRESELRYSAFMNSTSDLAFLKDENFRYVMINKANQEFFGKAESEIIGKTDFDLMPPDAAQKCRDSDLQAMQSDGTVLTEEAVGSRVFETVKFLVQLGNGQKGIGGLIREVTERKEAEKQLRMNEARLQSLHDIGQYKAASTQDLLDFALNEAIKLTESKVGYIYHYDEEKSLFELNTWSKDVMKECEVAEPQTLYELDKTGLWGEAVRQRKPIIVNDFQAPNPLKRGYPEGHVELHNFITIPIFSGAATFCQESCGTLEFLVPDLGAA